MKDELEELSAKIANARQSEKWEDEPRNAPNSGGGVAINMVAELVATMAIGGGAGHYGDEYFHLSPILLLCGLMVGALAGLVGIKRINDAYAKKLQSESQSENDSTENNN
jgi:F0F1-type ATP synthase assembly protein I